MQARNIPALDYILANEPSVYKRVGHGFRHKDDDALALSDKGWYHHKRQIGGRTALDYLVEIKGYGLVDAVCLLLNVNPYEQGIHPNAPPLYTSKPNASSLHASKPNPQSSATSSKQCKQPLEQKPFIPPLRYKDNKRVIAYLQSRGIDKDLILDCIRQGSLYESALWHNCVFTGKDEKGKTRFAALRGTTTNFKCDADGSDKRYGFMLPPENPDSREAAIFEAPIDCLSHQTMCRQGFIPPFDGWRLSLGGTSDLALKHFLETHIRITHCIICTDNDEAGNTIAVKISSMPGITTERFLPSIGNDWNDELQAVQKILRTQHRAPKNNMQNL